MSALNGTVAQYRDGRRGFFGDNNALTGVNGAAGGPIVFDNTSPQPYPTAPQTQGVWYGTGTEASIVALGANAPTAVDIGNGATVTGANSVAVGNAALAYTNATAVGYQTSANANGVVAVGVLANGASTDQVLVGHSAHGGTTANYGIAIGSAATIGNGFADAIAIGRAAAPGKAGDICIGATATTTGGADSIAIVTAQAVTVAAAGASDVYINIRYNGAPYKLLLHT